MSIEVQNLSEAQAAITKIAAGIQPALRRVSPQAQRLLIAALSEYPAPRPGQRYVRTGTLGRGWQRATPLDDGFQLSNDAPEAGFVQGDRQAFVHVNRWQPASQIARDNEQAVLDMYDGAIAELTT